VLRFLLGLVACATLVPLCGQVLLEVIGSRHRPPEDLQALAIGLGLGLVLVLLRRPNWFLHTLTHETCHLIACWLLGVKVHKLSASDGHGGEVSHQETGPVRTTIIALAPYLMPLYLGPLLLARALTPESPWRELLTGVCALAYPAHLTGLVHNVRTNFIDSRGDLAIAGRLLSLGLILCGVLLLTALAIIVLWDDSTLLQRLLVLAGRRPAPA
jgi:hypothetical protein